MGKLTLDEMETIISFSRKGSIAEISSTDPVMMDKLDKLVKKSEEWKMTGSHTVDGEVIEKFYRCPKRLISLRVPNKKPAITEEQRRQLAERARINFKS